MFFFIFLMIGLTRNKKHRSKNNDGIQIHNKNYRKKSSAKSGAYDKFLSVVVCI